MRLHWVTLLDCPALLQYWPVQDSLREPVELLDPETSFVPSLDCHKTRLCLHPTLPPCHDYHHLVEDASCLSH